MSQEIEVGTQFTNRTGRRCTVADVWKTFNLAGELMQTRYVCTHEFMGQTVMERDVLAVTIQRAIEAERIQAENLARVSSPKYRKQERKVARVERAIRRENGGRA